MRAEQSGSSLRPISVNEQFFDGILEIIEEIRSKTLQQIADQSGIRVNEARSLVEEEEAPKPRLRKRRSTKDKLEFTEEIRQIDEEHAATMRRLDRESMARRIKTDFQLETHLSFNIRYKNGYSFRADNVDEVKDLLTREPGQPESLGIRMGAGYRGTTFGLRLYNSFRAAIFDISGERDAVDHLHRRVAALLRACEPDHSWLHKLWVHTVAGMILNAVIIITVLSFIPQLAKVSSEWIPIVTGLTLGAIGQHLIGNQLSNAFPKCQFEYGPYWRRQKARRTAFFACITVILAPLLFEILF